MTVTAEPHDGGAICSEAVYGQGGGDNVVQIQQTEREVFGPGGLRGARVTFRAVPGMTREWFQRVVDCHLARNAVKRLERGRIFG